MKGIISFVWELTKIGLVAAIIVAFPAFVLHALEGGRRFLAARGRLAADLWPEASTPPRDGGPETPPGAGGR